MCICVSVYVRLYVCMYVCVLYLYIYIYIYILNLIVCVYACVCIYIYMYVCMYIHIHTLYEMFVLLRRKGSRFFDIRRLSFDVHIYGRVLDPCFCATQILSTRHVSYNLQVCIFYQNFVVQRSALTICICARTWYNTCVYILIRIDATLRWSQDGQDQTSSTRQQRTTFVWFCQQSIVSQVIVW